MEVLGSCEAHPFYSEGGDQAKEDASSAENAEPSHVERLGRTSMEADMRGLPGLFLTRKQSIKIRQIVCILIFLAFRELRTYGGYQEQCAPQVSPTGQAVPASPPCPPLAFFTSKVWPKDCRIDVSFRLGTDSWFSTLSSSFFPFLITK